MEPIKIIRGRAVVLAKDNIDTDQIIPARFLKVTDKKGLGDCLFYDWRYDSQGSSQVDFILNQPQGRGARILIAGDNFGCGSSREHAPWALVGYGFAAIISTSFADIFRNNSLKNGLLPIVVPVEVHAQLIQQVHKNPDLELIIDLEDQTVRAADLEPVNFPIDEFSKRCLLDGVDEMGYILKNEGEIRLYEKSHPPRVQVAFIE
jgi:3-isopropylmalate/(R)-2-methylmalate dehydratase small subunit